MWVPFFFTPIRDTSKVSWRLLQAHSEPCPTSNMDRFAKIVNPLTIFAKHSILDVLLDSECVSDSTNPMKTSENRSLPTFSGFIERPSWDFWSIKKRWLAFPKNIEIFIRKHLWRSSPWAVNFIAGVFLWNMKLFWTSLKEYFWLTAFLDA